MGRQPGLMFAPVPASAEGRHKSACWLAMLWCCCHLELASSRCSPTGWGLATTAAALCGMPSSSLQPTGAASALPASKHGLPCQSMRCNAGQAPQRVAAWLPAVLPLAGWLVEGGSCAPSACRNHLPHSFGCMPAQTASAAQPKANAHAQPPPPTAAGGVQGGFSSKLRSCATVRRPKQPRF